MDRSNKKILATLFFAVFATVTGVGIVVPLLPIYAHDLGAGGIYIGLIFGAFALSRTFFLPLFGRLSDKKGRKTFILPGLFTYALISVAFIYATDINALIVVRFFQGVASAMLMPVIQAYVGDITSPGHEGFTMGLHNMFMLFGLSLGPLIGGWVKDQINLQASFLSMGMLALLGFILCLLLLPPTQSERAVRIGKAPVEWKKLLLDRTLAALLLFRFAYVICIGTIWGFLPLYVDLKLSPSSSAIGILILLGIFISGSLNVPMGLLADRFNKKMMVALGGLIVGAAIFSFAWADSYGDMVIAKIFFGLGGGICMPALTAMAVIQGNKNKAMGSVMALLTAAHSLGMLSGALLGGILMDLLELRFAFPASAIVMAGSTALFFVAAHDPKRSFSTWM